MKHRPYIITSCLTALVMLAACTGCGSKTTDTDTNENSNVTSEADTPETTETAEDEEDEADKESGEKDADSGKSGENKESSDSAAADDSNADPAATDAPSGGNADNSGNNGNTPSSQNSTPASTDTPAGNGNDRPASTTQAADRNSDNSQPAGQREETLNVDAATVTIGEITARPGQKEVPVPVKIEKNPGYSACGIRVLYDPALTLSLNENGKAKGDIGPAAKDLMTLFSANTDNHVFGFVSSGEANCTADGTIFTCYVDIPDDAQPGTVYSLLVEVLTILNTDTQNIPVNTTGGEIRIE